jgi:hypothetical protein
MAEAKDPKPQAPKHKKRKLADAKAAADEDTGNAWPCAPLWHITADDAKRAPRGNGRVLVKFEVDVKPFRWTSFRLFPSSKAHEDWVKGMENIDKDNKEDLGVCLFFHSQPRYAGDDWSTDLYSLCGWSEIEPLLTAYRDPVVIDAIRSVVMKGKTEWDSDPSNPVFEMLDDSGDL